MKMLIILPLIFMLLKHPLSLGMMLIIQTCLISIYSGKINSNYWFSYILFLIMIGGLMILFIYMTSIASNEKFYFSNTIMILMILLSLFLWTYNFKIQYTWNNFNFEILLNFKTSIIKYFNSELFMMMNIMIIYLLISLIAIVTLTNSSLGPLRQHY